MANRSRSVSKMTWAPPAPGTVSWVPAGTGTESVAVGSRENRTVVRPMPGSRPVTPAIRSSSRRYLSRSRLARAKTGAACSPNTPTSASPASPEGAGVQSGV